MNTGLQDAANLAWKLAIRVKGRADDELVDSYDDERRTVGHAVVRSTGRLFDVAAGQTGWRASSGTAKRCNCWTRRWSATPTTAAC